MHTPFSGRPPRLGITSHDGASRIVAITVGNARRAALLGPSAASKLAARLVRRPNGCRFSKHELYLEVSNEIE